MQHKIVEYVDVGKWSIETYKYKMYHYTIVMSYALLFDIIKRYGVYTIIDNLFKYIRVLNNCNFSFNWYLILFLCLECLEKDAKNIAKLHMKINNSTSFG